MNVKMVYTANSTEKLRELEITRANIFVRDSLIIIRGDKYAFVNPEEFAASPAEFLEEKDFLKIKPEIKEGDYVQVPVTNNTAIIFRKVLKKYSDEVEVNGLLHITYKIQDVKRVPTYIVAILKEEGYINA